jgi:hypothetical protein
MPNFFKELLTHDSFPIASAADVPFGEHLSNLFFNPLSDNEDFPVHGPNVIRLTRAFIRGHYDEPGFLSGPEDERAESKIALQQGIAKVQDVMQIGNHEQLKRTEEFLRVAALFHDIGKTIRRANHPQIGANLLRSFDPIQREMLVDALEDQRGERGSGSNRFSRICSIVQHHDKYGVVSTGEGALPIFSDILYFSSDKNSLPGVLKNVTQVMLLNLADIAAVNRIQDSSKRRLSIKLAFRVGELRGVANTKQLNDVFKKGFEEQAINLEKDAAKEENQGISQKLRAEIVEIRDEAFALAATERFRAEYHAETHCMVKLREICCEEGSCLGLRLRKIRDVFADWWEVVQAIKSDAVSGNRGQLKLRLLELEQNPARAIIRILRLLQEAAEATMHDPFDPNPLGEFLRPTSVETVLVGTLGAHQFQTFCKNFAAVAKLDYGLAFFQAVMCAVIRKDLKVKKDERGGWARLSSREAEVLKSLDPKTIGELAENVTLAFVKVLECLVTRYTGVLERVDSQPRRFGFQLRDLTRDERIRQKIVELLCDRPTTEPAALTWIADEVTIWSMD